MAKQLSYIQERWDDGVTGVGLSREVKMHLLAVFVDEETGMQTKEWHYFGTTQAEKPPTTADPVTEHPSFKFPTDYLAFPDGTGEFGNMAIEALFRKLV